MPCLIELGNKSSEIHEKIGKGIGLVCDLAIITSKDKFKEIKKGFDEIKRGTMKFFQNVFFVRQLRRNLFSHYTFCQIRRRSFT